MRRQDFQYDLPDELIARHPARERRGSRLLQLDGMSGELKHGVFTDVLSLVRPGDLMVFNDTRVIPARVFGQKETGGKIEILIERVLSSTRVLAHVKSSKSPKPGSRLILDGDALVEVAGRQGPLFILVFSARHNVMDVLDDVGHMPLPPYIDREDTLDDQERYQTVYGNKKGAVAAPTAGLHFDDAMLQQLKDKGVELGFVTLHVGAGTFQPVRVDNIAEHAMHSEVIDVSQAFCDQVAAARDRGGRIIAVGTTSVRCLETAARITHKNGPHAFSEHRDTPLKPYVGDTDIFLYPGCTFKVVDCLITNFHLPESTLLMLVSAFVGYGAAMAAYRSAVEERYRFFSYGDAMFLSRNPAADKDLPSSLHS